MKQLIKIILCLLFLQNYSLAQENQILLKIHDREISKAEFERIFKKNNLNSESFTQKDVEEYMELFINFKLKVIEAENLGLDTLSSFKNELGTYRNQLAQAHF